MTDILTGAHHIAIVDHLFERRQDYAGFSIDPTAGTVRFLAFSHNLEPEDVCTVLRQMIADQQLVQSGYWAGFPTYSPIKE